MTRDQAIRKVLACLRLAGSSNPNEAAAALRQARKLMQQYGLSEDDAAAAEIREAESPTRCRGAQLPRSLMFLASIISDGYRCEVVIHRTPGFAWFATKAATVVRFYGANADAQVAAYAFTVLRRQLEADKASHTKRIRKRANKERRGEEFAIGWVRAVAALFPQEALPEGREQAIALAIQQRCGATTKAEGREVGKNGRATYADRAAGYAAGKGAQLNSGLSENGQRRLVQA